MSIHEISEHWKQKPDNAHEDVDIVPGWRNHRGEPIKEEIRHASQTRELVFQIHVVSHVVLVRHEETQTLANLDPGREHFGWKMRPAMSALEEMRENSTPKPEQALDSGSFADVTNSHDQRNQEVNVRRIFIPTDSGDSRGIPVMILESPGNASNTRQPVRAVVQDQMNDSTRHVGIDESKQARGHTGARSHTKLRKF